MTRAILAAIVFTLALFGTVKADAKTTWKHVVADGSLYSVRMVNGKEVRRVRLGVAGRARKYKGRHVRLPRVRDKSTQRERTAFGLPYAVRRGAVVRCLPAGLHAFLRRVQAICGRVTVISGHRPGSRVRGTGSVSLHASCRAADYQIADRACALRVARSFPGGHSTDYHAVSPNHFHVSYARGGREWGARF